MIKSLNLLPTMLEQINVSGDPVRGAGFYGHTKGLHTVAINVQNFNGRVLVQASIATNPTETDWFSVLPDGQPYIQYPRAGHLLPSDPNFYSNVTGENSTMGFNFLCNAVWVRAMVDRSYLIPSLDQPRQVMAYGVVNYVLLNY